MGSWREVTQTIYDVSGINRFRDYVGARGQSDGVFIWIPKTAGTSLQQALGIRKHKSIHAVRNRFSQRGMVTFGHMHYPELVHSGLVSGQFDSRAFKFALVRNPYDRAVSLYRYLQSRRKISAQQPFLSFLRALHDEGIPPIGLYNSQGMSQCNPQIRWVENVALEYLGHLERLTAACAHLGHRMGIPDLEVPHANSTVRRRTEEYYCPESRELVAWMYREDFAAFGYARDELCAGPAVNEENSVVGF